MALPKKKNNKFPTFLSFTLFLLLAYLFAINFLMLSSTIGTCLRIAAPAFAVGKAVISPRPNTFEYLLCWIESWSTSSHPPAFAKGDSEQILEEPKRALSVRNQRGFQPGFPQ